MSVISGNSSNASSSSDCQEEVLAPSVAPDTQSGMFSRIFSLFSRNPTAPKPEKKYKFVDSDFVFLNELEKTYGRDFKGFEGIWLTEEKEFQPFNTLNDKLTAKNKFKVSYTEKTNQEGKWTGKLGMRVSLQGEKQEQCEAHIAAIRTELATPVAESETKSKVQEFFRKLQKTAAENAEITQKFDLLIQGVRTLKELSTATTSTQSEPLPTEQTLLPISEESDEIEIWHEIRLNRSAAEDNLFQTIAGLGISWNSDSDDGFDNAIKQLEAQKPTLFSPWASAIKKNYIQTVDSASPASFKTNWKTLVNSSIIPFNVSAKLANTMLSQEAYSITKIAAFVASIPVMAARVVSSLIWRPLAVIGAVAMTIFQKISASKESSAINLLIEQLNASNRKPEVIETRPLKQSQPLMKPSETIKFLNDRKRELQLLKQEKIQASQKLNEQLLFIKADINDKRLTIATDPLSYDVKNSIEKLVLELEIKELKSNELSIKQKKNELLLEIKNLTAEQACLKTLEKETETRISRRVRHLQAKEKEAIEAFKTEQYDALEKKLKSVNDLLLILPEWTEAEITDLKSFEQHYRKNAANMSSTNISQSNFTKAAQISQEGSKIQRDILEKIEERKKSLPIQIKSLQYQQLELTEQQKELNKLDKAGWARLFKASKIGTTEEPASAFGGGISQSRL